MSERVLIIGAGHVGRGLFRAFRASAVEVLGLHGRKATADATSSGVLPVSVSDANTIVIAVRDDQIDDVIEQLVTAHQSGNGRRLSSGTTVVHTSGSAEPSLLPELAKLGLSGGTFHPLIPFANPARVPELLRSAWIGIDGDDQARATSRRLAGHVGARTLEIPPGGKAAYHAAAVMSSNLPVVLAELAVEILTGLGVPVHSAEQAVRSLMESAVANLADASPTDALTGPIVRGDTETVARHLAALRATPDARAVYKRLSHVAAAMAAHRGVDRTRLREIQRLLLLR